mgnify:FL=1
MKRIALFLAVAAVLLLAASCSSKKKQTPAAPAKPVYTFTKEDTAEIMTQVEDFLDRLEKKDIRGAVEMLNFLAEGDSIKPLNPMFERRQAMSLMNVLGVRYDLNHLTLRSNTNNEVKIDITLFDKAPGDPKPNMTGFYLRPVKFEGKWYLTVWDNITNTNQDRNKD